MSGGWGCGAAQLPALPAFVHTKRYALCSTLAASYDFQHVWRITQGKRPHPPSSSPLP